MGEGLFWKKSRLGKPSRVICYANTRPSPTPPPKKLFKKGVGGNFLVGAVAVCAVVGGCFREEQFSLRLGHTRILTSHCDVIHYARVASLPLPYRVCAFFRLYRGRRSFVGDGLARPVFRACRLCCGDVRFREEQFSLWIGHARVLTSHRDVIHYARVASLLLPYKGMGQRHPPYPYTPY